MSLEPRTAEECHALPEAAILDAAYPYFGAKGISGDSIIAFTDADGFSYRVDCRRQSPEGPDVWVKVRV